MSELVDSSDISPIMQGTEADKAADYANYFCSYAYLYHQKQMLMDHNRMRAYHSAIMSNKHLFEGKIVLDVGTGSGVLAIWSAQAGARKVFAVEYTDMAKHAKNLVAANDLSDVVEVIQSSVEDLQLPCRVDIIVSEWMGYILLRESMLDSVIRARDRWLAPGGAMFPSHATMYFSAISYEEDRETKCNEYQSSMRDWRSFLEQMQSLYNVDMSVLTPPFKKEQQDYYIYSGLWTELHSEHVVGQSVVIKHLDLRTCTLKDSECVDPVPFQLTVPFPARVSGFAGWFTVDFNGSVENPVQRRVVLSTGPEAGNTHWGQQVFYLKNAIDCSSGQGIRGVVSMTRQEKNKRLYNLNLNFSVDGIEDNEQKLVYEIP